MRPQSAQTPFSEACQLTVVGIVVVALLYLLILRRCSGCWSLCRTHRRSP